jgi:hypothetical protein
MIDELDTMPLPVIRMVRSTPATFTQKQELYQRLKALSDASGVRLLFVYRLNRGQRVREPHALQRLNKALASLVF